MLKGIAASAGVSVAKHISWKHQCCYHKKEGCDAATEISKFDAALEKISKDIEGVNRKRRF